jgi:hypothetical protein
MTWAQILSACFAALFSLAYSVCVFVAGIKTGNEFAWKLALVCLGFTYLGFMIEYVKPAWPMVAGTAVAGSIVAGILAGVALLVR